jgi:hypothetical protein
MSKWPTAKHFSSWLSLAPGTKVSGGRLLSSKTHRSANRAAALLPIAAVNIGRTQTALGAFYRRLAARTGKAKAVTATARKLAVLFSNALRFGMYTDPGASYYGEQYRQRVLNNLRRRAHQLGFTLVADPASHPRGLPQWTPHHLSSGPAAAPVGVVERAVLEHGDKNPERTISDGAERTRVTMSLLA